MSGLTDKFIMNMTSDPKVRQIINKIQDLSQLTTRPPEMSWYDSQFDPMDEETELLPFTVFMITGTAGAGKSTSISALHQNLNCLITGATVVAAQNLSSLLRTRCPTIFQSFGFKSRHINMPLRQVPRGVHTSMESIQQANLSKYWHVLSDIIHEIMEKKKVGLYDSLTGELFELLAMSSSPEMWFTNIIIIDEAGTLPAHILTAVVFLYWFYNSWLSTPLYKEGRVPCIVCVGSPTQTSAIQSTFNHLNQKTEISQCENVLSFIMGTKLVSSYTKLQDNWALFINNRRCNDVQFSHMLKTLEYGLPNTEDIVTYLDQFVVPASKICDPKEYTGWTRLFISHNEVKAYISRLHLTLKGDTSCDTQLFTCPVMLEIFHSEFDKYKLKTNIQDITITDWLTKNLSKVSNYSQFVDQDMNIINTNIQDTATTITYQTKYVKNSYISLNGKTRRCIYGYVGTVAGFRQILECETFIDLHGWDNPKFVYSFINTLIYNSLYFFSSFGAKCLNKEFLKQLSELDIPTVLITSPGEHEFSASEEHEDIFYTLVDSVPDANHAQLPFLIQWYNALKDVFFARSSLAVAHFGPTFMNEPFSTYTHNVQVRNGVEYTSSATCIYGLLDFASTVDSYQIVGYTFMPVSMGKPFGFPSLNQTILTAMPHIVVQDSLGFVSCLERNVNKVAETMEDGTIVTLGHAVDYGISTKLAMTIVKAQGMSLQKVAIVFGTHKNVQPSHVYVAISRATDPRYLVMDKNPLRESTFEDNRPEAATHIVNALHNPNTLLVY
ncbi:helicase [Cricetid gammaherpesvirus 2]|uniref:Helicase n=1 Tax=Cricetid gammaherpesvirus 2 TaxID=1605972 RepID=E9M5M7_9GAMA|nr:helicase [Cricetid gammaherpesvirus 2]ADW24385.1 helicase [Cricetid gammaherpesvirus 2]ADW24467.1 helicase [Cricetid gammaherpesvirus 2]